MTYLVDTKALSETHKVSGPPGQFTIERQTKAYCIMIKTQ